MLTMTVKEMRKAWIRVVQQNDHIAGAGRIPITQEYAETPMLLLEEDGTTRSIRKVILGFVGGQSTILLTTEAP